MMNKAKTQTAVLVLLASATIGYSKPISLDSHLTIDDAGEDSTFQVIPDLLLHLLQMFQMMISMIVFNIVKNTAIHRNTISNILFYSDYKT